MEDNKSQRITFAAIDPYIQRNIVLPTETQSRRSYVNWGDSNNYPEYLQGLYRSSVTLKAVIDGVTDYVAGNDVTAQQPITTGVYGSFVNRYRQSLHALVRRLAFSYAMYGGCALQVIRSNGGGVAELYALPLGSIRTDKDNEEFIFCEDWRRYDPKKAVVYPRYMAGALHAESVVFRKNTDWQTYPSPVYAAAVPACEIERNVDDFHMNALENGFASSIVINMCNGIPEDEVAEEIERNINAKFAGHENAGRIAINYAADKEHAATIEKVDVADYGDKYSTLAKHTRQQIFTAFRANPNLFGIPTESLGFSSEEYESAFRLFNRTMVQPMQAVIADMFDELTGTKDAINITPFSL